jgi:hypothetical protein
LAPTGNSERRLGPVAFGLGVLTDLAPPGAWGDRPLTGPLLRLRPATSQAIAASWSGAEGIGWEGTIDGAPFVAERGRAGDYRFVHGAPPDRGATPADRSGRGANMSSSGANRSGSGDRRSSLEADPRDGPVARTRAIHHLSADASVLRCAPVDPNDPGWWRVVLDSVLFTVALLHGYEALHAGAIATPDGVVAITAAGRAPGSRSDADGR